MFVILTFHKKRDSQLLRTVASWLLYVKGRALHDRFESIPEQPRPE